ncbi:5560_t:CDS:2 [Dentiscutata erythropus]|uniref:5560_t:CDS:1 n=1 Tax=Dentiscutata erythropus TaxID=1348616 RepID=A0A9N9A4D7_9GLOM|nr:5560_t:CDS:2 [Dentiscutata erythropus]
MTFNKLNRPDLISNYWDKIQKDLKEYVELILLTTLRKEEIEVLIRTLEQNKKRRTTLPSIYYPKLNERTHFKIYYYLELIEIPQ